MKPKLLYGKYNNKHISYHRDNTIDGVNDLEDYKQYVLKEYNANDITDIKFVYRTNKSKQLITFTAYFYQKPTAFTRLS